MSSGNEHPFFGEVRDSVSLWDLLRGNSAVIPLPLEGSLAAGDSGISIWADIGGRYYLVGIATFGIYSCYAAQSY